MKNILFLYFFILTALQAVCQSAVLSADKMNVVYVGVDNPISVAVSKFAGKQIVIKSNYGILSGKDGRYIFRISAVPKEQLIFTVSAFQNKKLKSVYTFSYRVKYVPDPVAKYPCSHKNLSSCIENLIENGLKVELDNFDFYVNFSVVSFDFKIIKQDSSISSYHNQGSLLQPENKAIFKALIPGEKVEISNIRFAGPDDIRPLTQKITLIR